MSWNVISRGDPKNPKVTVWEETLTSVQGRAIYSSEFYPPPGKDYQVLANIDATNLSASTHVELFVADMASGTFRRHPDKSWFNATTMAIDQATKQGFRNVSSMGQDAVVKFKVPSGGGSVKLRVVVGVKPITE